MHLDHAFPKTKMAKAKPNNCIQNMQYSYIPNEVHSANRSIRHNDYQTNSQGVIINRPNSCLESNCWLPATKYRLRSFVCALWPYSLLGHVFILLCFSQKKKRKHNGLLGYIIKLVSRSGANKTKMWLNWIWPCLCI